MTFIIYQLYLNQYFKTCKFHSHWKLEFVRFLPAGKGTLSCLNLQILNPQAGDYWSWEDLPPEAGLWRRTHHCSQAVLKLSFNIPLFYISHFLRSKHRSTWKKRMGQLLFPHCYSFFMHLLILQWGIASQMLPNPPPRYSQECPESLSQAQEFLQVFPLPP